MNALEIARDLPQVPQLADLSPVRFAKVVDACGVVADRRTPLQRAMADAFAAIDASKAKTAHLNGLSQQAADIADAEIGPRIMKASMPFDPEGFVAKARHNSAWNAVWRREAARLMGKRIGGAK